MDLSYLINRLEASMIEPPDNLTDDQLIYWLLGYTACDERYKEIIQSEANKERFNGKSI